MSSELSPSTAVERYDKFSRLVMLHQSDLYGYILALVQHREDALDIQQQTLITLWQKFDGFDLETNFLAWALRVAQYKVLEYRKQNRRRAAMLSDVVLADVAAAYETFAAPPTAEHDALTHCLDKLNSSDRQLIETCYRGECSVRKASAELGRPERSVSNSLLRIRRALFDCIQRILARENYL